jgi:hypothetical protein
MTNTKDLFLNQQIRCGGFYELCIQVSPTLNASPLEVYNNLFWNQDTVNGPYDNQFNRIEVDITTNAQEGILTVGSTSIPFKQFNIREENPIETGFNWFDISFYTSTIEHVFGLEPQHWSDNPKCPGILQNFLGNLMQQLYKVYPFQLAFIGFEISGQFYLSELKNELNNWTNTRFFVGKEHLQDIKEENKKWVTAIN